MIDWNKTSEYNLPEDRERILFYRPTKLTKVGEMVFMKEDKDWFIKENTHWAKELNKPGNNE